LPLDEFNSELGSIFAAIVTEFQQEQGMLIAQQRPSPGQRLHSF
jgi:hypothetical protein